jgi:hypothetical protein
VIAAAAVTGEMLVDDSEQDGERSGPTMTAGFSSAGRESQIRFPTWLATSLRERRRSVHRQADCRCTDIAAPDVARRRATDCVTVCRAVPVVARAGPAPPGGLAGPSGVAARAVPHSAGVEPDGDVYAAAAWLVRSGLSAAAQASSWPNKAAAMSWCNGAGLNAVKFSKSVNSEKDKC